MILFLVCFFCIYCEAQGFRRHKITILPTPALPRAIKKSFLNWNQYDKRDALRFAVC